MRGKANEGLILFKSHFSATCPTLAMKRLSPSARRFYFDCPCPFWIMGTLPSGEKVPRQTTGVFTLKEAEASRDAWIHQRSTAVRQHAAHGYTIGECIETYLTSRTDELAGKTLAQTRLLLTRLRRFCELRNVIHMRGLTVDLLERFKTEGMCELASTSKGTAVAKLRRFLREAYRRDWIKESLVDKVSTHKAAYEQKEPYTEEEIVKLLAESGRLNGGTHGYARHPATFRLLLELMLETGIRVGDAIRFTAASIRKSEAFWVYSNIPQKQKRTDRKKTAEAYLTDRLKRAIDAAEWLTPGKWPFFYAPHRATPNTTENPAYLANEVYERMKTIGSRCGVEDCRPHRLRDTFAVRCLLAGMSLEDVSRLLNHSSVRVTELYYAKWVSARKIRLERLLSEAFVNTQSHALGDR